MRWDDSRFRTTGQRVGSTAHSLVEAVKENDAEAWKRFVDIYGPLIYSWCRDILQSSDACDVVQEVLMKVQGSIGSFEKRPEKPSFRAWLRTISRNKAIDKWRSNRRTQVKAVDDVAIDVVPESARSEQDESTLVIRRLLECVQRDFSDRIWMAFWRTVIEQGDSADVARELQLSVNSVRNARCRILKRLREEASRLPNPEELLIWNKQIEEMPE